MTTDSSKVGKKNRILCIASLEGIDRAKKALIRLGFETKSKFAESKFIGRNTVTKFFDCQPIQVDSFKKICQELKLDWQEIIDMGEKTQLEPSLEIKHGTSSDETKEVDSVETHYRQVTIIDRESQKTKAVIELEGDIDAVNRDLSLLLELALQNIAGNTMKITSIKPGSIKLFVEGSPEDIERLMSQFKSGELTELRGFPITNIKILTGDSEDQENREREDKWRLVREIISQPVQGRNLINVDLSDADLSKAFLFRANLSGADLSGADLSGADLSGANLRGANLSGANLRGATLMGATLMGADLSGTNLSGAKLSRADLNGANLFGSNLRGADLRGAILRGATLMGATLMGADLSGANLSGAILIIADLSGANLRGANLSGAILSKTNVTDSLFGNNEGISRTGKNDLIRRGAIFGDSPVRL